MPLIPYVISGKVCAADATTGFPGAAVVLRNVTQKSYQLKSSESDGSFSFDLKNFVGGYSNGDALKITAQLGCFSATVNLTVDTGVPGLDQSLTLAVESVIGIVDQYRLTEELVIYFRSNLMDPKSRDAIKTAMISGTGSLVKFILPDRTVKFIKSVYVNGALKANYADYFVEFNDTMALSNPTIYFLTPPANGAVVEITYGYGGDWIYPNVPRTDLGIDSYPRVSIKFISFRTREDGLGALGNITDVLGSVQVYSSSGTELQQLVSDSRKLIMQNKKGFHYFKFIEPQGTGPVLTVPGKEDKIITQNQDFLILNRLEVI
jgi:hypothetical protein